MAEKAGKKTPKARLARDAPGAQPRWLADTRQKFDRLLDLPPNWDGSGARAVDAEVLDHALRMLLDVVPSTAPAPYVVPSPSGGVQVEWHEPAGDIEIEFKVDGTASFYMETDDREIEESAPVGGIVQLARQNLGLVFSAPQ